MDFVAFYHIGQPVVAEARNKKSVLLQNILKKTKNKIQVAEALALKLCYLQLFSSYLLVPSPCINDYLLDFDTEVKNINPMDLIRVPGRNKSEMFCFSVTELLTLFLTDLSQSNIVHEPTHGINSLVKNFRLPVNPYSMVPFTYQEIQEIISQIVLKKNSLPMAFSLVYTFLGAAPSLYRRCQNQSKYEVTRILGDFFENQGFRFQERFSSKDKENNSQWKALKPVKTKGSGTAVYQEFLQDVFLHNIGNGE